MTKAQLLDEIKRVDALIESEDAPTEAVEYHTALRETYHAGGGDVVCPASCQ